MTTLLIVAFVVLAVLVLMALLLELLFALVLGIFVWIFVRGLSGVLVHEIMASGPAAKSKDIAESERSEVGSIED